MGSKEIIRVEGAIKESNSYSRLKIQASDLVALCFKVPFKFRQEFKLQALKRGVTMTELLVHAVEKYVDEGKREQPSSTSSNTDLRK